MKKLTRVPLLETLLEIIIIVVIDQMMQAKAMNINMSMVPIFVSNSDSSKNSAIYQLNLEDYYLIFQAKINIYFILWQKKRQVNFSARA